MAEYWYSDPLARMSALRYATIFLVSVDAHFILLFQDKEKSPEHISCTGVETQPCVCLKLAQFFFSSLPYYLLILVKYLPQIFMQ